MIQHLGKFEWNWSKSLASVIESATPATWDTVRYWRVKTSVGQILDINPHDGKKEEDHIADAGGNPSMTLTNMEHDIPKDFQKMIDEIGLEKSYNRLHVQWTGNVFNWHKDRLARYNRDDPSKVLRVVVMLTDFVSGHFYTYNNDIYENWKAGDIHTFDWQNDFHCTANASLKPRVALVTTGIIGEKTKNFLDSRLTR